MCRLLRFSRCLFLVVIWLAGLPVFGQQATLVTTSKAAPHVAERGPYRRLAPGVMESVDTARHRQVNESVSRHDIVELLAVDPEFDWAKKVFFRHDIWALKFQFKVPRLIWVDVPQASGKMQRKLILYLVYSVTNADKTMHPVADEELAYKPSDGKRVFKVEYADRPIRFIPQLLLKAHESLQQGLGFTKVYPDRVIPVALGPIQTREDRNRRLLSTVEICSREIAPGETLWGVATWSWGTESWQVEDIDPRTRQFSIYIQGLTNAYRWKDEPGAYKANDPLLTGRQLVKKTLKLNFWRPGDDQVPHEEEIRYGVPGGVDYGAPYTAGRITITSGVAELTGGRWPSWSVGAQLLTHDRRYVVTNLNDSQHATLDDEAASTPVGQAWTYVLGGVDCQWIYR